VPVASISQNDVIPWHRHTEALVIGGIGILIALSLGFILLVTTRLVTARSLERASEQLEAARAAFSHLVRNRADFASAQTRLITALPVFRAHMTDVRLASDHATVDAMAEDYRQRLEARFCIVTGRDGRWIAHPGWIAGEKVPVAISSAIDRALAGQPQRHVISTGSQLFLLVSEPARFAEETLGTMTVGYLLDDPIAEDLAKITHAEITLVATTGISGSSLERSAREQLNKLLREGTLETGDSLTIRELDEVPYATGTFPLVPDRASENAGRLVLLQDWRPTRRFLDELRQRLFAAGLLTFALALVGGVVFSRRMSRPLKDIAEAAGEIASGSWGRQMPLRGSAEAVIMARAFNEMAVGLRHWHEQAQDRAERLQASYERFHSVTESARDGIVSTGASGSIEFWNRSASDIFGCEENEALGTSLTEFIAEPDRQKYLDALLVMSAATGATLGRTIELTGIRKDGSRFPIELSLSAWRTPGPASVTAVVRDVTERKQTEEVLRQREAELRHAQKMEAIGLLAGGVAHDFNNILMVVQSYGELLRETLEQDDRRRADVDEILNATGRAAGLTRQLLAFSRRQVLAPQVLALDEIVIGVEKMLRRLIGEDIELSSASECDLARVRADPGQIEQVLLNLAVNARDAMPQGGRLTIALANAELGDSAATVGLRLVPGRYVRIEVSDTGTGIPPEIVPRIFEPFFTTKSDGKGTGLGLATVYGIIQQSGGAIDVESIPGRGTTFRIYLPQCSDDQMDGHAERRPQLSKNGSETVLLVEDDEHVRALVKSMLRRSGYTVLAAAGGELALEIARRHLSPIHLLLTDVVMPNMNGRVLAEHLTALRPDTRVLFMSGYSDDAVLRAGIRTAGTAFIQKPFSIEMLTGKLREVFERV
jgi:PAS domain S-box-containing protein